MSHEARAAQLLVKGAVAELPEVEREKVEKSKHLIEDAISTAKALHGESCTFIAVALIVAEFSVKVEQNAQGK